jgi:hypothetical protein
VSLSGAAAVSSEQLMNDEHGPFGESSRNSTAFVQRVDDDAGYQALVPSRDLGKFSTPGDAFHAVFDALDSASIYTGSGKYPLQSPLSVPEGFRVSNTADGMFVNGLDDEEAKCIEFAANTGSDYLKVDCGNKAGILLGERDTGSDIDIWYADVHRAGTNTEAQHALRIQGSGIKIFHVNVFRGSKGIFLDGAYDVHVLSSIITDSDVGLRIDGAEHCFFDQMDFDSCRSYAVRIDDASAIRLQGLVWNNTDFGEWPYRSVEIGANRPCDSIFTDVSQLSAPGAALYVDEVEASHLRHDINEADEPWYEYDSGITTTERTADSCLIEGYVASTIANAVANVEGGTLKLAGAGADGGTYAASGDGSRTTFRIPHELGTAPERTSVRPRSRDATGDFYVRETDESVITLEYVSPPADGSENLRWEFEVSLGQ